MKHAVIWTLALIIAVSVAYAQEETSVPPLINYQGMLADANGNPLAGTKKLTFNIYDAAVGGNLVWGPQVFDGVPLVNGRFNVILGSTDTAGRLIISAFSAKDRYLGIKVDTNPEISPRQQILSTPFAINAEHAENADKAELAGNANLLQNKNINELKYDFRTPDYDSGWFYVEKSKNYDKDHNLNTLPILAIVWAASDSKGTNMYLMDGIYSGNCCGSGLWLQRITASSYRISTGSFSAMSAFGIDHHWKWDNGSGYIKVLMWK